MHHVVIMKKSWGLLPKILSGKKTIESRWYQTRRAPWNRIYKGDIVYFKNSGTPVECAAVVEKVIQFSDLTPMRVRNILQRYGNADGIAREDRHTFFNFFRDKKYCILIFLKNPQRTKPFEIDKTGFGAMSAWITVDDISKIKK